ncbi:hypothetical protein [Spongiivirga citrea]|uniref:Uncharacterized protein n=1 Tax=Spongiivirga citrea TaxID=1481457 RepID=A0A6M0CX53_9FLAO|nr:hypothetical protein [Spongiivirga citrea]NER18300.1 hypothetical protein [Spongiivirga citrea]
MNKTVFVILSILSIISYIIAGILLTIYFTEESPGMIMIFLIPTLLAGLVFGVIAFFLKRNKKFITNPFLNGLYYLNIALMVVGLAALVYTFLN